MVCSTSNGLLYPMDKRGTHWLYTILVAAVVCSESCFKLTNAQLTCSTPSGIITTNSEVESIFTANPACISLPGDITIGYRDCSQPCQVTDLSNLNSLQTITGSLTIQCCPELTTLNGFTSLLTSGSLTIYYNQNLTSISGFQSLMSVTGSIVIAQNPKLVTVSGLSQLQTIDGHLDIDRNTALTSVSGLRRLMMIRGSQLVSGHALSLTYNTGLTSLEGFHALSSILYGTVRVEGNTALCYAGYPQWGDGVYVVRSGSNTEDKGIDWRSVILQGANEWQYTWDVPGGGYPTLIVQNNAATGGCGSAACDTTCQQGAGCLGPSNPNTCGTCTQVGGVNTCDLPTAPPPVSSVGVILGVVLTIFGIIALVLLGLAIYGCIKIGRRYNDLRQGSFDISVSSVEDGVALTGTTRSSRYASDRAAEQIATVAEPTTPGSIVTRKGVQSKPKLDAVVVSSYRATTNSTDGVTPGNSSRTSVTQRPKVTLPIRSAEGENPQKVKRDTRSLSSRPKSESSLPLNKRNSDSNLGHELSTEDILQRLRDEQAEIPMNFPWDQIKLGKEFGTGDFGKVYHGDAKKLLPGQKKTTVVVKQLKEGADEDERETFLRPVEAMKLLQHPNVLSLLGVSMKGPSIIVLLEYCSQGNFKTYLVRKRREAAILKQNNQLFEMACDMAAGLDYLHSMNIAHNDFAARSCLVTNEGRVKLGDYGITRQTFMEDYYSRKPNQRALPIRWMAPELIVLQGRNVLDSLPVSMPGNIWSFGVSLWEVSSFAQWPYDEISNEEVLQTLKTTGKCILENPLTSTDHIAPLFEICQTCWQSADLRPSMSTIHTQLKDLKAITPTERRLSKTHPRKISQGSITGQRGQSVKSSTQYADSPRRPSTEQPYKPRRPAPKKPAPYSENGLATFPRTQKEQQKTLVISNPAIIKNTATQVEGHHVAMVTNREEEQTTKRKKGDWSHKHTVSTEALLASTSSSSPDEKETRHSKIDEEAHHTKPDRTTPKERPTRMKQNWEPDHMITKLGSSEVNAIHQTSYTEGNMDQALLEEHTMGGFEGTEADFILEPPEKFSQSSFDDIQGMDDLVGMVGSKDKNEVSFKFDHDEEADWSQDQFGNEDMFEEQEARGASGRSTSYSKASRYTTDTSLPKDKPRRYREKRKRKQTPATAIWSRDDEQFDEFQQDSPVQPGRSTGLSNPAWPINNDGQFDEFEQRDAMEEDDLSSVILDEDVAALIW